MGNIDMEIDLPVAKVIGSKKDSSGNIIIAIETTETAIACTNCGRIIAERAGSDAACKVKHVPIYGVATFIVYRPHKYICKYCQGRPITTAQIGEHYPQGSSTNTHNFSNHSTIINQGSLYAG